MSAPFATALANALHLAAKAIRSAAMTAAEPPFAPTWGQTLLFRVPLLEGDVKEGLQCALVPMRRRVPSELLRVDFDFVDGFPAKDSVILSLQREIAPFIIGVGEVATHETLKGFEVVLSDDRQEGINHVVPTTFDISPE